MDQAINIKDKTYWGNVKSGFKKHGNIYGFLLPAIILTLIFSYFPMLGTLISFKDGFNLYSQGPFEAFFTANWTAVNYFRVFDDANFVSAINNTLIISFFKIIIVFPLSIVLAIQLSEVKSSWLSKTILIILCLPQFLSWSVAIGIWTGLLNDVDGAVNNILMQWNLIDRPIWFFGENDLFKPLAIFLASWKTMGWNSIIFYAAIISIDKTYYEAAKIDGASKIQRTWHLTIPSILPTIALMLVMNITYIMDAGFEQIYTMMNAETRYTQQILGTYLYDISIVNRNDIPFAVTLGVLNGLIALTLMLAGNKFVKKTMGRSLW